MLLMFYDCGKAFVNFFECARTCAQVHVNMDTCACGNRRTTCLSFCRHCPSYLLRQSLSLAWSSPSRLADQTLPRQPPISTSPDLGLQTHTNRLAFFVLNLGFYDWIQVNRLPTELTLQLRFLIISTLYTFGHFNYFKMVYVTVLTVLKF